MSKNSDSNMIEIAISKIIEKNTPVTIKNRCIFYLRSLDSPEGSKALQQCIRGESVLLDHEIAYVLGQMRQPNSVEFLINLFQDELIDPIVRHEAIEALGNFSDAKLILILEKFKNNPIPIISDSVVLAIAKINETHLRADKKSDSANIKEDLIGKFGSFDPAFPMDGSFEEAKYKMKFGNLCEKYKAMFYLRDLNSRESIDVLGSELINRNRSKSNGENALLRHELAYVFGQMENEHSIKYLKEVLEDSGEAEVVRHEAAEALGNISNSECLEILKKYAESDIKIVRESCEVGLKIAELEEDDYFNIN